jgi:uncharacterized delta-60 repeat protein
MFFQRSLEKGNRSFRSRSARWAALRLEFLECRTLPSGGLDLTFNGTGKQTIAFNLGGENPEQATAVAVQPDGKTVVVGNALKGGTDIDMAVARLNVDGTRDAAFGADGKHIISFNLGGGAADLASGVAVQPDGKIVVVGTADVSPTDTEFAVARLLADGTPDAGFGTSGKLTVAFNLGGEYPQRASSVAIQPDGKIVVAGFALRDGVQNDIAVVRLNTDGTRDATFGADGKYTTGFNLGGGNNDQASGVVVQPDGKIVVSGTVQVTDTNSDFAALRLLPDATPDNSFGPGGKRTVAFDLGGTNYDNCTGVALQSNGKIVLGGTALVSATNSDFAAARLNADGTLDATFGTGGKRTVGFDLGAEKADLANGVAVQPDGKIVLGGLAQVTAANYDFAVAQLNADGTPDPKFDGDGKNTVAFDLGGSNYDAANALAIGPGGKVVLAGFANVSATDSDFAVARLTGGRVRFMAVGGAPGSVQVAKPDGTVLGTFKPFGAAYNDPVAVAFGDVNNDGTDDLVVGATIGNPNVKVYNGAALTAGTFFANPEAQILANGFPYAVNFNVGVSVAAGDVNGDGFADIITGAVPGNPHVKVFDGKQLIASKVIPTQDDPSLLAQGFAYGINFNVGANVAAGDVNGDGLADIITGATAGNPHTKVYDAKAVLASRTLPTDSAGGLLAQWFPYALQFNVGAFVAAGDYNGDGYADVVTGASIGNPEVRVFSGKDMAKGAFNETTSRLDLFLAFEEGQNVGVSVAAADFNGDGKADVLAGSRGGASRHRVYQNNLPAPATILPGFDITDAGFTGPVYVAA